MVALLVLGAFLAGLTWWHYTKSNPSTRDAVLIVLQKPVDSTISATTPGISLEQERAQLEMTLLIEDFDNARKAIEHAVTMVEEQKENFSFAQERYERLMPLVESGALDPLTASQIQSAYIAARASLAQAKYLLAQAQQDYGTPEYRNVRLKLLRSQFSIPVEETAPPETPVTVDPDERIHAMIEAVFTNAAANDLKPGMLARVTFPSYPDIRLQSRVSTVESVAASDQVREVRVQIPVNDLPATLQNRKTVACQVTVDTTVSKSSL